MDTKIKKIAVGIVILIAYCAIVASVVLFFARQAERPGAVKKSVGASVPGHPVMPFPPHPGTIKIKNLFDNKIVEVPIDLVPPPDQFIYYKNGKEVEDPAIADDRIPIVREEILPLNKTGEKTALNKSTKIHIKEYGPKGLIRERTVEHMLSTTKLGPAQLPPR